MDVGQNARERALPWRNFVGHAAFLKGSAAMLGQFGRLIQSDREKRSATALAGPDTGGEAADRRGVEIFVKPGRGGVLRRQRHSPLHELDVAQPRRVSLAVAVAKC